MAKIKIFRRGHAPIEDNLHFESVYPNASGQYRLSFQNISDTAELRLITIDVLKVEIPFVPKDEVINWISVKHELPKYEKQVLVNYLSESLKRITTVAKRVATDAKGEHWIGAGYTEGFITHWMPLPEPPREYVEKQVTPLSVPYPSCKGPDGEGPGT